MNLFEIDNAIMNLVDEETGEIADYEQFEQLAMARDEKIENVALWIKNLKAEATALKAEKDAFAVREKAAANKAENLANYISAYLAGQAFKTTKVSVSFRKSERLELAEGAKIPEEFLKYKEPDVDKTALKKAIKSGQQIDGVSVVENLNIQIR